MALIGERAAAIGTGYDETGGWILRQPNYRLVFEGLIPHTAPACRPGPGAP
ncbi:hypothetical protein ACFWVT_31675 [Streptomyces cyaneofuscatus]|uniref:hypothetical protein n=1 Tax=Streptomyces cyaneofuscatus TaxID=66883 RepID=UPI003654411D